VAATLLCLALGTPATAQVTTLRVGTLAGEGTPWHQVLQDIGARWQKVSGGKVRLTIFAGTLGDESDMIRRMRSNSLQMAAVTSVGLETIAKELSALSIPLLFKSYEELDYVRDRINPRLEKVLEEKGFVVLNWGDAGWVRFFSVRPAPRLDDLRQMKLFTWAGSPQAEEMYKDAGFRPVPLAPTDILQSLQTKMIEAFPAPAIGALGFQWFGLAKNMLDLKFAPIVGATIITRTAWERIDPSLRDAMMREAREIGERSKAEIRRLEETAVVEMQKRGLTVVPLSPAAEKEWQDTAERFYGRVRGEIVQPREFDEVMALVKEYRASHGKAR
jgi:TRAP-type C4-dicarboxylate transport system substrate-binding protein